MKKAKDLKEARAVKIEAQRTMFNVAKSDGEREFTTEEKTTFTSLQREIETLDIDVVQAEMFEKAEARAAGAAARTIPASTPASTDEPFNLLRYISNHKLNRAHTGAELTMFDNASREAAASGVEITGLPLPMEALSRAISVGGNGSNWVETTNGGFIEALREKTVMAELGATFLTDLVGDIQLPKIVGGTATWEDETDANADSGADTEKVTLSPKRVGAVTTLSSKFLKQTSPAAAAMFASDLAKSIVKALDNAAINGDGVLQPEGILNTTGIGSVACGTNGAAPSWLNVVQLETEVATDSAEMGSLHYLTNPKMRGKLKTSSIDGGSGLHIWATDNTINGYPAHVSTGVPSDLVKGTSGSVCSAVVYGNFNDVVIGTWGVIDLIVDPYSKKGTAQIEIAANLFADVAIRNAESFSAIKDGLTS